MGYPVSFLERQQLLRALASCIIHPEKIHLRKHVIKVDHIDDGVVVYCSDGSQYEGDVIVGADGVHSFVRREMWRAADADEPGFIPEKEKTRKFKEDKKKDERYILMLPIDMIAEYSCVFAISSPHPLLPIGHYIVNFNTDASLVVVGKEGRVFWFCFSRMDRVYGSHEVPRFTLQDAQDLVQRYAYLGLVPGAKVTLGDLWETRQVAHMTALEEAFYDHWTWGRFACVGDSVHKVTPNLGAGAMSALECAGALADALNSMCEQHVREKGAVKISLSAVQDALVGYQRTEEDRMRVLVEKANLLTRVQAMRGPYEHFLVNYLLPLTGDATADDACEWFVGAHHINFLPVPARSLNGTMPFNQRQGLARNENLRRRFVKALPLLLMAILALVVPVKTGGDTLLSAIYSSRAPYHLVPDIAIFYAMLLFEASRRVHAWSPLRL